MALCPGDAFLLDPDGGMNLHMWVVLRVCFDDGAFEDVAITVNITSVDRAADRSCVLNVGDHPFIEHESYAFFARMRKTTLVDMEAQARTARRLARVSPDLLKRLLGGAMASPHTRRGIKPLLLV